jgi:3'-phosphoadenosine 5'-phosphosulfate sulfotransferase (PAPS reductase)/FAD synthetase
MSVEKIFRHHERILLLCSGGKDAVALLYHLENYWDRLVVGWINTGDLCPEIEEFMLGISQKVPNFMVTYSDSRAWRAENGWPSPLVPADYTLLGRAVTGEKNIRVVSNYECCKANVWSPIQTLVEATGATAVLTGQRKEDTSCDPRPSGTWIDGVQYFYPIDDWTLADVQTCLKEQGIQDPRFFGDDTSIDCMTCTGFPQYTERTAYIKKHHPDKHKEVLLRWAHIKEANSRASVAIDTALNEVTNEI